MRLPCVPTKDQKFKCFCLSCSLQNGTLIVGWIGIVGSIILLLECLLTMLDIIHFFPSSKHGNPTIIVTIVGFISLLVNAFLIYGARIENPLLMLPYMLFSLLIFAVVSALVIYVLLTAYITLQPVLAITLTVLCVLGIVILVHAWGGIYSYYHELEDKLRPMPEFQLENVAFEKEMEHPEQYTPIPGDNIKDSSFSHHVPVSV